MDGIANSLLKPDYYYCFLVEICVILWFAKQIRVTYYGNLYLRKYAKQEREGQDPTMSKMLGGDDEGGSGGAGTQCYHRCLSQMSWCMV